MQELRSRIFSTAIFDAKIQVNLCFWQKMQFGRREKWKVFYYQKEILSEFLEGDLE